MLLGLSRGERVNISIGGFFSGPVAMVLVLALSACTKPETQEPPVSGGDL